MLQIALSLKDELVVDNFAGGGGASTGIEAGIGRPIDIAINHDPVALAVHEMNHPQTAHYATDIREINPRTITGNQPVGLAWFSPDCKHFSKAKGGKPVSKRVRGLAWVVVRWAAQVRPRVIMLENVEEFEDWGPVGDDGMPCPKRKGMTFKQWVRQLRRLGYAIEWRQLRGCDYGAPTIRKRLFVIARCDGRPIAWPEPSHGPNKIAYRTAAECIDWSIPCPSIFSRKRPLADNTLRRIAHGVVRYVIDAAEPFIVPITHAGNASRVHSTAEPLRTITTAQRGEFALVSAFLAKHYTGVIGGRVDRSIGTITAKDHHSVVTSNLIKLKGTCRDGQAVTEPLHTVQAGGTHYGEVRAFLLKYYGTDQNPTLTTPMHTLTTKHRVALVTVAGVNYIITDIGMRMLTPRELFRAQGFPDDYQIDGLRPDGKVITKSDQVRLCGNSVNPDIPEALVRANFEHERSYAQAAA